MKSPPPEEFVNLIIDRDVRVLYTVGEMTAEKLYASGIRTVRDIREQQEDVIRLLGKQGRWITQLARGVDDRKVTPYRPEDAKSIGREVTFQKDVDDLDQMERRPVRLIGAGIHSLSGETGRQLSFDDILEDAAQRKTDEVHSLLRGLQTRYGLDFAGHLEEIYQMDTLHKTIEYMRKHC